MSLIPKMTTKRKCIAVDVKKEVIKKYENGARITDIAAQFKLPKSTVATILKKKKNIVEADVARGVSILSKRR